MHRSDAEEVLDLRGTPCPMNFVKTKLQLESMQPGERLTVILDAGQPIKNVPRSAASEGHTVVRVEAHDEESYELHLIRGEL